jgi:hypothetical protein
VANRAPIGGSSLDGDMNGHQWWPLRWGNPLHVEPLDWVASARASSACVPARRPGRPIVRARLQRGAVLAQCDAGLRGKGEVGEGRKTDKWVPLASERKEKGERCGLAGCGCSMGWAGGLAVREGFGPG